LSWLWWLSLFLRFGTLSIRNFILMSPLNSILSLKKEINIRFLIVPCTKLHSFICTFEPSNVVIINVISKRSIYEKNCLIMGLKWLRIDLEAMKRLHIQSVANPHHLLLGLISSAPMWMGSMIKISITEFFTLPRVIGKKCAFSVLSHFLNCMRFFFYKNISPTKRLMFLL
jgi:hypothetical protein